ncbi:MAG: DUF917 domain-containing protein [Chloroflexi bacterium]|uniref:DUF917 domain-containing protein n=1 Tax=Candidatus Flexifilum breve TaxID=3140694 RepID=UPI003135C30D|nr:DUF917 domain-containing protein [Chloroflexota bacterium]MBK9746522.1 DUF917 domain-containing protein [Chloroflexota bacterium]
MLQQVTLDDIQPIALGAGILGTGGGGSPYLGSLILREAIKEYGAVKVIDPHALPDDGQIPLVGHIGAPTASIEKMEEGSEILRAVRLLERHTGKPMTAIGIAEIGGSNSMAPMVAALQAGLPVVDGDSMGRAFPEVQMSTFLFDNQTEVTPLALVDAGGNEVVISKTISFKWAEDIARTLATLMGATAGLAGQVVTGAEYKRLGVNYTLSLAHSIGHSVMLAQDRGADVPESIAETLNGRILMRGKITDVNRRTTQGFARGSLTVEGFGVNQDKLYIEFQNEFLIANLNGQIVTTVPNLITIVTDDTGEAVSTELLRYGLRVAVIAIPAARALTSESALKVVGPGAFGYDVPFTPMSGTKIGERV